MPLLFVLTALCLAADPGQWLIGAPTETWFGVSVALSGETLAVGNAPGHGGPWALVYEERGGEWVRTAELGRAEGNGQAGSMVQVQVELSGDTLALFSWGWPEKVKLYERRARGWVQIPFEAPEAADVDVLGDEIAVATGASVEIHRLKGGRVERVAQVPLGSAGSGLVPHDIALTKDRIVVGLPYNGLPELSPVGGKVMTLRRGREGWALDEVLVQPPSRGSYGFGVGLWGGAVVGSAPFVTLSSDKNVRIGTLEVTGDGRTRELSGWADGPGALMATTMDSLDGNDRFVVSGLHAVTDGAMWGGIWVEEQRGEGSAVACSRFERDLPHFGFSVALDGERLAAGAPRMDLKEPGRVWVGPVCGEGSGR